MNRLFKVCLCLYLLITLTTGCKGQEEDGPTETRTTEVVTSTEATTEEGNNHEEVKLSLGKVKGHRYSNDYFDIKVDIPESWVVLSESDMMALMTKGHQVLEGQNGHIAKDLAEVEVLNLFGVFRYPVNEEIPVNPSFLITAEKLDESQGIVEGKTYLEASKRILEQTGMPYEIGSPTAMATSEDRGYGVLDAAIKFEDQEIRQRYMAFVSGDYMVSCVMTYEAGDGESAKALTDMMNDVLRE